MVLEVNSGSKQHIFPKACMRPYPSWPFQNRRRLFYNNQLLYSKWSRTGARIANVVLYFGTHMEPAALWVCELFLLSH